MCDFYNSTSSPKCIGHFKPMFDGNRSVNSALDQTVNTYLHYCQVQPPQLGCIEMNDGASTTSCDLESRGGDDFSIDEVRSRLHGQLDIQPVSRLQPPSAPAVHHPLPPWFNRGEAGRANTSANTSGPKLAAATSSNDSEGPHSEDDGRLHHHHPTHQVCSFKEIDLIK